MKKEKIMGKIFGIAIVFALIGAMLGGLANTAGATSEKTTVSVTDSSPWFTTEDITITLEAGQYEINEAGEYSVIEMEGFGSVISPGEPKLPSKTFLIGLPPGAEAVSVDIVASEYAEFLGEYRIMPAPPIISGQENEKVRWKENEEIYSSGNAYPASVYEYLGMGQMRKYNFARVRFCPVAYYPASNKLGLYRSITLKIEYEITQSVPSELMSDTVMDDVASQIIFNYASMKSQYQPASAPSPFLYNYVIIITDSLQGAVEPLVTWKTTIGYSVNVATITWIEANYSGADLPEKIRNFLIDKYTEWGIEYVLIVGSHSTIPMRYCYPSPSDHDNVNWQVPSDYYYADLTGDWDSDGDGYFGEYGHDNVDFYPEVYVGRIPIDDYNIVQRICDKTIEFAEDAGSWKQKALLLGARLVEEGGCSDGFMEHLKEGIFDPAGYSVTTMYEMSPYECDYPLNHANVLDVWLDGYGTITWSAHGSSTTAYIMEDWEPFIMNSDASDLDDNRPSVVFSASCMNAWPERSDNLGNSLLENGAVAFVGASRISYISWGGGTWGGSLAIDYHFYRYLLTESQNFGEALYHSKVYCYDNGVSVWGGNMYGFNLYGDPSLGMATIAFNNPPNAPSSPSPVNHATGVSNYADLSWTGGDPDAGDTVTYDVYFGTNSTPPLILQDQPGTTYDPGTLSHDTKYYWQVVARDNHGFVRTGTVWDFTTEAAATVSIDAPAEVAPGGDFVARVNIAEVENLDSYQFEVTYDHDVIQVVGLEGGTKGVTSGLIDSTPVHVDMWAFSPLGTPGAIMVLGNVPGVAGVSGSGYMAEIHFHVVGECCNTSDITFSNGKLFYNVGGEIPATWLDDLVHACLQPGDANGDCEVDMSDVTKVERIILGLDPTTPCADCNQDGEIDMSDVTCIERIILGLD